jgi:hypothetical protein
VRAAIYRVPGRHHQSHADLMSAGLERHGIETRFFNHDPDLSADFAVVWGWRVGDRIRKQDFRQPILVMERGYLGDRFQWTSLGWDGLNGRARFNEAQDEGERFEKHFGHLVRPWSRPDGYVLIIGQVDGDMALRGTDYTAWAISTVVEFHKRQVDVRFRHHPEAIKRGQRSIVPAQFVVGGALEDAFAEASQVVTMNSNTGVESVLYGLPTVTADRGAMAWPVTSHSIDDPLVTPDRKAWLRDMAWRQWREEEIGNGEAWEVVRGAM